jgi:hypothetical protein
MEKREPSSAEGCFVASYVITGFSGRRSPTRSHKVFSLEGVPVKVGSHDNFLVPPWYKILYRGTGVSTAKSFPHLQGNFASFAIFSEYVCELTCLLFYLFLVSSLLDEPHGLVLCQTRWVCVRCTYLAAHLCHIKIIFLYYYNAIYC